MALPRMLAFLAGSTILRDERSACSLRLELGDVVRFGVVHAGELSFAGVSAIEVSSRRPFDRPIDDTRLSGTVDRCRFDEGRAVIDVCRQTGPGDADEFRFIIRHTTLDLCLNASPLGTLRRLTGL